MWYDYSRNTLFVPKCAELNAQSALYKKAEQNGKLAKTFLFEHTPHFFSYMQDVCCEFDVQSWS